MWSQPGMTEPEPRFGETFGFALFCQGSVSFTRFWPVFCPVSPGFARFLPRFCLKMPVFCPVLLGFARFVWFCPNSPGFVRFRSSPVCLVSAITVHNHYCSQHLVLCCYTSFHPGRALGRVDQSLYLQPGYHFHLVLREKSDIRYIQPQHHFHLVLKENSVILSHKPLT